MLGAKRLLFMGAFITVIFKANAQEFGGNAPSIKWKQLNTAAARIIFPPDMDSQAMKVATIIDQIDSTSAKSIGIKSRTPWILSPSQPF